MNVTSDDPTTDALAVELAAAVGADGVATERADVERYEDGWRYGKGRARLVCKPRTTEQVSAVVRICRSHGAAVHPIGGNTGLVAASNPDASGEMVVVSLERLNSRVDIDLADGTVTVDGGVLLSQLNEALGAHGRTFPIDLGADPQVGGMVATNTGGSRLVRYGDVRANLLGVEVVLPDGTVWSDLKRLRKNNTGLDAKQLFVGTSGAYGIVTGAVLKTWPRPRQVAGALVCATSGQAVVDLLAALEPRCGEFLTAFEAMSKNAVAAVLSHGSLDRDPFSGSPPAYAVLVELSSAVPEATLDLEEVLGEALAEEMEAAEGSIDDVVLGDVQDFWHIRHQISESLREEGTVLGLDVSVPRSSMAAFTDEVTAELATSHPKVTVADFGHWGDGGSHLNLVWPTGAPDVDAALKKELQAHIYGVCVNRFGGSYSAEHGVGPHNIDAYRAYASPFERETARVLAKELFGGERFGTVEW